jgi:hypothetical protein
VDYLKKNAIAAIRGSSGNAQPYCGTANNDRFSDSKDDCDILDDRCGASAACLAGMNRLAKCPIIS